MQHEHSSRTSSDGASWASEEGAFAALAALPPAPRRPVQWRRTWKQIELIHSADPRYVLDAAYGIKDALGGMTDERLLRRVLRDPVGRALVAERPDLPSLLADHEALARMPEGSLGRAYLHFAKRHGINAAALIESEHRMSRDFGKLDPLRQWFSDRLTVLHDLWHVLAGYDAISPGESALICFSIPQGLTYRPMPIFVVMMLLARHITPRLAFEAFRRGRRAASLVAQPYEQLLWRPLAEVRRELNLFEASVEHAGHAPEGMLIPLSA